MNLKEKIASNLRKALKTGDRRTVSVLRMINARILEREIELRRQKGRDYQLKNEEVMGLISAYAKQRLQSIESYRKGRREDLVKQEQAEFQILQEYLPAQLSQEAVEVLVDEAISETGASGPKDIGLVMKSVMPKVKGAIDGKVVNQIVQRKLTH